MVFKLVLKYEVSFWERWLYKSKCNVAFFVLFSIPIFLIIYVSFNIEFLTIFHQQIHIEQKFINYTIR